MRSLGPLLRCTRFRGLGYSSHVDANELELVERARNGETAAFTALVERCWTRLVGFARSVAGDTDAEDCVQEAMVIVWEKLASLKECAAFDSWVMRIVGRRCMRRARGRARFVPLDQAPEGAEPCSCGGTEAFQVESLLALLPPRQRAVMHLTVIEGMTDSEIGTALAISPASVRSHRRRARETLGPRLRQVRFLEDEEDEAAGKKEPGRTV